MAITRSIAKKNMIQMKRWDYSHYSPPNRVLSPKTKQFAAHFSTTTITKKGKNKIAITRPVEQKLGSAEVGLQLHSPQIFQAFFLQLHNIPTFYAFLLKYGNRFYQTIKAGRGKAGKQGILSHLTAEARIEVKSSMVRKSDNTVFLR